MARDYDAIVIGAGIIGAGIGYELSRAGWKTLNIDRLPAAGYGSTSSSCAVVRMFYSVIDSCALAYESWHEWMDWPGYLGGVRDERGLAVFNNCGCLVIKTEHNGHLARIAALMEEIGCPTEHWSAEEIKARLPIADTRAFYPVKRLEDEGFGEPTGESIAGGLFFPHGGYVSDPQLAAHNLQRAAEAKGAVFRFKAEVADILKAGGRAAGVKLTDGEEIRAPVVINVAGPHSTKVNALAGVLEDMRITTRALKHEVAHLAAPASFDFGREGFFYCDSDVGSYARPEVGNHMLVGSEDPPCDSHEWVDPDDYNPGFTEQVQLQTLRLAQRFPELGIPSNIKGVVDLYDVTEDWIPIYDKSSLPGYYMAIGTSGNQFKNAPTVGRLMTRLIEACEGGQDHDSDPVRFKLEHLGREVSLGFYSRRREVNPDSSRSVLG